MHSKRGGKGLMQHYSYMKESQLLSQCPLRSVNIKAFCSEPLECWSSTAPSKTKWINKNKQIWTLNPRYQSNIFHVTTKIICAVHKGKRLLYLKMSAKSLKRNRTKWKEGERPLNLLYLAISLWHQEKFTYIIPFSLSHFSSVLFKTGPSFRKNKWFAGRANVPSPFALAYSLQSASDFS